MSWNLARTLWGYVASLLGKYTGLRRGSSGLEDIFNYLRISERIATSGQPTEAQFRTIREAGFARVVNLAPADAENSLADEPQRWAALGVEYIHLPVDFSRPTERDYRRFVAAMQRRQDEPIWIHCAVNARVSAFMYRYRTEVQGVDTDTARRDMLRIWEPFGVWRKFIDR